MKKINFTNLALMSTCLLLGACFESPLFEGIPKSRKDVTKYSVSDDGVHIVFMGDVDEDIFFRLYHTPVEGKNITILSPNIDSETSFSDYIGFHITPNSSNVVFYGALEVQNVIRLYSAPITGGTVTTLWDNPSANEGFAIFSDMAVADDSQYVVFSGDIDVENVTRLYSVPVSGGDVVTLSPNMGEDTSLAIDEFAISPDGSRVVFLGDLEVDGVVRLYSVPIAGGDIVTLSQNLSSDTTLSVSEFQISDDSSRVVFVGDTELDDEFNIYSVPIDGGEIITLAENVGTESILSETPFMISQNSSSVVYMGDRSVEGVIRLYSVPTIGGEVTLLSHAVSNDSKENVISFSINNNSSTVFFWGDTEEDEKYKIYSVPINGGAVTDLYDNAINDFAISNNDEYVVCMGQTETTGVFRLFSVPVGGDEVVLLSHDTGSNKNLEVLEYAISPDNLRVVFRGDTEEDEVTNIYSVPIAGGDIIKIAATENEEPPSDFTITPDSSKVIFLRDVDVDDEFENTRLYSVPIEGGAITQLSQN